MAKIAFRNQNGLRDDKRKLKNGLSPKVTAQVAALNGSTVYGTAKLRNSNGTFGEIVVAQPSVENPDLTKQPPLATEGKQDADTTHASGHDTLGKGTAGADDANPTSGTPAVGPDGKTITNAKKPLPAFIQKAIDAKKDDDAPAKKKVKNSVYPSIRGNYHSALSAMRVKLANSDMDGDDDDNETMIMNDIEAGLAANQPAGQPNQPASTIIYGNQDLSTPAAALVTTTQDPSVQ
jgi:hypothetical protein